MLAVLVLLLGALCAAGGVAAAHWVRSWGSPPAAARVAIPRTAGMSEQAARQALAALPVKLTVTVRRVTSADVAAGRVIGTRPLAGTRMLAGAAVTLVVSSGRPLVTVPHIGSGENVDDATAALQAVGLVVHLDRSYDGGLFGRVVNVDPAAGTPVPTGSTVTLTVV